MGLPSVLFLARLSTPFAPPDLNTKPLGGSETALAHVARGLARLGHEVTVVANPGPRQGWYDGVRYVDFRAADWRRTEPDVTVIFRQLPDALRRCPGRVRVLWVHDHIGLYPELPDSIHQRILKALWRLANPIFGARVPYIVAVSQWLGSCFIEYAGWPKDKVFVIPNGVDPELFDDKATGSGPEGAYRLVYTSVPERGLSLLIKEILPRVWSELPETELHVFSYRALDGYASAVHDPRVKLRGGLSKPELAATLSRFHLWTYPTDFPETSCIAAMEAQASGLPCVASRRYALTETISDGQSGILVPGRVGSKTYVDGFAEAVVALLKDPLRRARMGEQARRWILGRFTWPRIAQQWSDLLQSLAATE